MKKLSFFFFFAVAMLFCADYALAQSVGAPRVSLANNATPRVVWIAQLRPADARRGEGAQIVVSAKIPRSWHLYSTTQPAGGPLPTVLKMTPNGALEIAGAPVQPAPKVKFDDGFKINIETYEGAVSFGLPAKWKSNAPAQTAISLQIRSMLCSDTTCLPPQETTISLRVKPANGVARAKNLKPVSSIPTQPPGAVSNAKNASAKNASAKNATPTPNSAPQTGVSSTRNAPNADSKSPDDVALQVRRAQNSGVWSFLLLSLTAGFAALLTPCVFPMIPITISVFSKPQNAESEDENGKSGVKNRRDWGAPIAYCAGIVGTFTLIGLVVSGLFGAGGITRLAANPWLNLAMAALFVLLALNLFGVYEIIVPSSVLQKLQAQQNAKSSTRNARLVVPLLMGLTFTLTSFTCTVPFVGTLLVATSKGSAWWPLLGMLAFSSAFALPFFLLALFPQWLSRLPKAGSWMVSLKATMGFLELAAALKFLSQADFVWQLGWLTRPVFLSIWSTLAIVAGCYLLRWLRLPRESSTQSPGILRRALGTAFCVAGIALLSGIGGRSLGVLEAYPPPADYGTKPSDAQIAAAWHRDYAIATEQSRRADKPLLINFTGYACTNCRVMEANVLPQPQVKREIANFVPVELYTDGDDADSRKNSKLQQQKFGTVALPLYVAVAPDGRELARLEGLNRDPQAFVDFLQRAQNGHTKSSTRLAAR